MLVLMLVEILMLFLILFHSAQFWPKLQKILQLPKKICIRLFQRNNETLRIHAGGAGVEREHESHESNE